MGDLRQRGHDSVLPNITYDFNKRHFIARSLHSVLSLCLYFCVRIVFFVDNVVHLVSYVNMCACHVYFTINLLTYYYTHLTAFFPGQPG